MADLFARSKRHPEIRQTTIKHKISAETCKGAIRNPTKLQ